MLSQSHSFHRAWYEDRHHKLKSLACPSGKPTLGRDPGFSGCYSTSGQFMQQFYRIDMRQCPRLRLQKEQCVLLLSPLRVPLAGSTVWAGLDLSGQSAPYLTSDKAPTQAGSRRRAPLTFAPRPACLAQRVPVFHHLTRWGSV